MISAANESHEQIHRGRRKWLVVLGLLALLSVGRASAVVTPSLTPVTMFQTSGGAPFQSATQSFSTLGSFQFAFGFGTDESLSPGLFLDSLTFTFSDSSNSLASIIATADGSGLRWAPPTPGTVTLPLGNLAFEPIPVLDVATNFAQRYAFSVKATLPAEFSGRDFHLYSDFFNNQNGIQSIGWISAVTVVPEPSTWALAATALVVLCAFSWRKE